MTSYTIFKTLHFLGLVMWLGGLFSLSSLIRFQNKQEPDFRQKLAVYGRKIYYFSNLIGLILSIVFGLLLLFENTILLRGGWFHAKLFFVFCLILVDHIILKKLKKIGQVQVADSTIKKYHSIVSLLFLLIAFLAINKPF